MSSLADAARAAAPDRAQRVGEFDLDLATGRGEFRNVRSHKPLVGASDWAEVFARFKLDPATFTIVDDTVRMSMWQQSKRLEDGNRDTVDLYSYSARFTRRADVSAFAAELAALIRPVKPSRFPAATGLPMVVCLADAQMGKDGPDADTHEELDQRFRRALAKVAGMVKANRPTVLIIADNGDPIEGITSSAPNQIATNTLGLDDQLRLWQRRLTETILTLSRFAGETHVAAVPSNHGEIRNSVGKVGYGDHGLGVARTVQDAFELLGPRADLFFHYPPSKHDVITYVDVADTRIAFTHGHHARGIDKMPQWIANQAASLRSPMRDTTIVAHGHYHQPGYRESRGRSIVSCSMFDPGSSWFENLTGEFSRPSITTFSILDKRVFDLRFVEP